MADPGQINADMLAFWNGQGGHTWVARQAHTDVSLAPARNLCANARACLPCGFGVRRTRKLRVAAPFLMRSKITLAP